MTPEEAYEEALRRIREAEKTGALELDLSGWNKTAQEYSGLETLNRLPPELERLASLDIAQPRRVPAAQRRPVSACQPHLAPIAQPVLQDSTGANRRTPQLKELYLYGCELDDLPPEVCGESDYENVLGKVRAHYEDLGLANESTRRSRACSSATAESVRRNCVAVCATCHSIRVFPPPTGFNSAK